MPSITRLGDMQSGHLDTCVCFKTTALNSGSVNVLINGLPCGRNNDTYDTHGGTAFGCPLIPPHSPEIDHVVSERNVYVNGRCVACVYDTVQGLQANGTVLQGSSNVFIGGAT